MPMMAIVLIKMGTRLLTRVYLGHWALPSAFHWEDQDFSCAFVPGSCQFMSRYPSFLASFAFARGPATGARRTAAVPAPRAMAEPAPLTSRADVENLAAAVRRCDGFPDQPVGGAGREQDCDGERTETRGHDERWL
jgi:hypothetical protein